MTLSMLAYNTVIVTGFQRKKGATVVAPSDFQSDGHLSSCISVVRTLRTRAPTLAHTREAVTQQTPKEYAKK